MCSKAGTVVQEWHGDLPSPYRSGYDTRCWCRGATHPPNHRRTRRTGIGGNRSERKEEDHAKIVAQCYRLRENVGEWAL
jgi:hypothetical protein